MKTVKDFQKHVHTIDEPFPQPKYFRIKTLYPDIDPQWPRILLRMFDIDNNEDKCLIIWLLGGPANREWRGPIEIRNLVGRRRILVSPSPYEINTYDENKKLVPEAYRKDAITRIHATIRWAKSNGYKIFLGGHSNGAARMIPYLSHHEHYSDIISGIILAAPHVGHPSNLIPVDTVKWNVPILLMHHRLDHSFSCNPSFQKWLYNKLKKLNKKSTQLITLTTIIKKNEIDTDGSSFATHHMFRESREEVANTIERFIDDIIKNKQVN
jgi:predicted esterase